MAVTSTVNSNTLTIRLNNGRDEQGRIKTLNLNITNIKKEAFTQEDFQKALNIVDPLSDVLGYATYEYQLTTSTTLTKTA